MHRSVVILLVGLGACGPFFRRGEGTDDRLRICVQNETVASGNIIARAGLVRFDVMPGQEECKPVALTGHEVVLTARTIGGGVAGPRSYSARLQPAGYRCWRWRLTESPASSADLGPCEEEFAEPDTMPADSVSGAEP